MPDDALIEQLNRGYVCPPDAGPAWRRAARAGVDMADLEQNLQLTPWERLLKHDCRLRRILMREEAEPARKCAQPKCPTAKRRKLRG